MFEKLDHADKYKMYTIQENGDIVLGETKCNFWNRLIGCQRTIPFESFALKVWEALMNLSTGLNQKAIARLFAKENGTPYEELNLIVCHLGGGITASAHRRGRVMDTTNALDGCGPFSPERSGSLPPGPLIKLCFSGKYTEDQLHRLVHGGGGLMAHLGTTSVPEVLERIDNGDLHARFDLI